MPTSPFTSNDILKHPVLIDTVTWDTTQLPGQELANFSIPAVFAQIDNFHARMLQVYAYFKPTVKIRFIINSTKFHQGKLICFYDPMESTVIAGTASQKRVRNQYMATGQPNVLLDAGYSNTGEIEIPFEHVLSYMTTNSTERAPQMGTIYIMVLNSLKVSTGATPELDLQIMLSCSDVELHIPMRPHTVNLISLVKDPHGFEPEGLPSSMIPTLKPKPSSGIKQVMDSSWTTLKTIPSAFWNLFTGNWNGLGDDMSTLWEATKDRYEGGFKMLGMDKPTTLDNKTVNMLSTTAPLAHMQGVDGSIRLAATPSGGYTRMDFSAANEGEMNIKEIIKTKMLFNQLDWTTEQVEGIPLLTIPVHPGLCNSFPDPTQTGYTRLNPTFLSYLSLAYEQWHGSINFRFDFTATQFHTGRILAVFEPNSNTTGAVADIQHYSNNPSYLFDLHENKTFEINIPFVSSTPRKATVNPTSLTAIGGDDELSLGQLYLFVYTPLAVTNNVPTDIAINCYISAGDDFVFEIPRIRDDIFYPDYTSIPPLTRGFEPQSAGDEALPLRSEDRTSPPSIIKGSGVVQTTCHYNEEIADVRDFARRYAIIQSDSGTAFIANPADSTEFYTLSTIETTLLAISNNPAQVPLTFISNLFTFWSGSLRYKIIPMVKRSQNLRTRTLNAFGKVSSAPLVGTGGFSFLQGQAGGSYPYHLQNSAQDSSTEVEIPFYSYYNQFLTNTVQTTGNFNDLIYGSGTMLILFTTDTPTDFMTSTLRYNIFASAGDDFKLRFLVSPPTVLIQTLT
jgi:hypothetical protein